MMDKDPKGETFLYCHGNSVIIRNLASPQMADIYTQHSCQVSAIMSGDNRPQMIVFR
mgnify:CR=1 FL=1